MSELAYNYKKQRAAFAGDHPEDLLRYDGCSLNLLKSPANNCHYTSCYGEANNVACGVHKLFTLRGEGTRVKQKKAKKEPSEPINVQLSRGTRIEERETPTEETDLLIEEEDITEEEDMIDEEDMLE
jgi:hypothetical protein